jgi:hypothetical protein
MPHTPRRALRLWKSAVTVALIAAVASWQPAMLVSMTATTPDAAHATQSPHGAHHSGTPHHHTQPFQCCTLCPLACAAAAALPSVPSGAPAPALGRTHRALALGTTAPAPVTQHRLPFPLGPPTLRIA